MERFELNKLGSDSRVFAIDIFTRLSGQETMLLRDAFDLGSIKYRLSLKWIDNLISLMQQYGIIYEEEEVDPRTIELTQLGFEWWVQQQDKPVTKLITKTQDLIMEPLYLAGDIQPLIDTPEHKTNPGPIDWFNGGQETP